VGHLAEKLRRESKTAETGWPYKQKKRRTC